VRALTALDGAPAGGRAAAFLLADKVINQGGITWPLQLASEYGQPVDSVRGAYYGEKRKREGGGRSSRPRRRETTPEDALADARASLERSTAAIDREVEAAKDRADEAKAEYEALKASAAERKKAITDHLHALV
jgi:hypothetical protein